MSDVASVQPLSVGSGGGGGMDLADLLGGPISQPAAMSNVPASIGLSTMTNQMPTMPTMAAPASGNLFASLLERGSQVMMLGKYSVELLIR